MLEDRNDLGPISGRLWLVNTLFQSRYFRIGRHCPGDLCWHIVHDFNNIMGVIVLYSQMLLRNAQLSAKHKKYANTINQQAKDAAKLIEQILDFSRRSVMEHQPMNLVPLVKEMLQLWKRTLPENIDLNLTYDEREYFVNVDPTRIQQVLMNLAVNAHHAMPNGGALRITLSSLTLMQDQMPPLPDMSAGDWSELTVSETGSGIQPQDLPRIFEPYFTTKAPGKGTGLGLGQVYSTIKQHDGYIDVVSQVGQGTTFTIYLPPLTLGGEVPAEEEPEIAVIGDCETIPVVEDAGEMREAVCNALEALNYRTLVASNGKEALVS